MPIAVSLVVHAPSCTCARVFTGKMPVVAFTLPCGSTSSVRSSGVAAASGAALCATASNRDGGLEAEILVLRHQLNLLRQRDCI